MLEKLLENLERHGANVHAHSCRRDNMQRAAQAGSQYLRGELIGAVDIHDFTEHMKSFLRRIVQSSEERADEIGSCFRHEKRLRRGKNQRYIDPDTLAVQHVESAHPGGRHRYLHHNVRVPARQFTPLAQHPVRVRGYHFGVYDTILHDFASLENQLTKRPAFPGGQRRIRRDAVEQAKV